MYILVLNINYSEMPLLSEKSFQLTCKRGLTYDTNGISHLKIECACNPVIAINTHKAA